MKITRNMEKISLFKSLIAVGLLIVIVIVIDQIPFTQAQRFDKECKIFGQNVVAENPDLLRSNSKSNFFYSSRLDTCVKTEVDELGNEFSICDIKRNYIKEEFGDISICGGIFYCDVDGVDNVILEKADVYQGKLFNITYSQYLDNGEGGPPRTLKAPDEPYGREKCSMLYQEKLEEIE